MSTSVYDRLQALGITLPPVATPAAAYVPFVRSGNLVFLSGHIARRDGKPWVGQLGAEIDTATGRAAARAVAIDLLGTLHAAVGDLGRVRRIDAAGAELGGIFYLRSIADADLVSWQLQPSRRLVIVGAGYIGLEVAAVARSRGVEVTVLEAAERVMARVVCREVSAFYRDVHEAAGVRIACGSGVREFVGDQHVEAVVSTDGTSHPCDLVVVGVGILPRTELAEQAGLRCENGIHVDEEARTSDPNIFAAGDCTAHPNAILGRRVRLESVHNAVEQAKTAASSILGETRPYSQVPWFWSDQYDLKLQIAGLSEGYDQVVLRGNPADRRFAAYYIRDGRIIAVDAVNSPRDFLLGKKLVAAHAAIDPLLITDAGSDLESIAENIT